MADFVVTITDQGRAFEAQQLIYGYGFEIQFYVLGAGGADPGNPTLALPLNLSVTSLPGQFFGPQPIDQSRLLNPTCCQFICIAQPGQAVGPISNLGLVATVLSVPAGSPVDAPVLGSTFLYAITNFPLRYKSASTRETFRDDQNLKGTADA